MTESDTEELYNRRREDQLKNTKIPGMLAVILTIAVLAISGLLMYIPIPEANKEIVYIVFGAVMAKWGDSIAYFLNSTHSSQEKNKLIRK